MRTGSNRVNRRPPLGGSRVAAGCVMSLGMDIALSLLVLTAVALVIGAYALFRHGMKRQAWLMLALAVVMALNVAIWTWPTQSGTALVTGELAK